MEDEQKNAVIIHATSQAFFHEESKDDEILLKSGRIVVSTPLC
jgi:hypothetical protein